MTPVNELLITKAEVMDLFPWAIPCTYVGVSGHAGRLGNPDISLVLASRFGPLTASGEWVTNEPFLALGYLGSLDLSITTS